MTRFRGLLAPALILILLAPVLAGKDRLGFRDVSHFYTPLYGYLGDRGGDQWLPLWNPLDHTGIPVLGETTTAFLYPIRYLCFALPLSAEVSMAWYVALHLILASVAADRAARWAGCSPGGSAVAGLLYPLSGPVLFLYCNPPFLVGAAWLPLVLGALTARPQLSEPARTRVAAVALAMMVLGGDPQTAAHAILCGAGVWGVCRVARRRKSAGPPLRPIVLASLWAALLTAPQLAASIDWSAGSTRVRSPETVAWWQPPPRGTQRHEAYQYSLPPWHLAELATPAAFGSLFPEYRRLSALIPGDGRVWTPTLYIGALTLVALTAAVTRGACGVPARWPILAGVSLLAALGSFGAVWWLQTLAGLGGGIDSAIGGPYWWLYNFLPGYDAFRYPAKWLPVFSLASSLIAARWVDSVLSGKDQRCHRIAVAWAGIVAAALAVLFVLRVWELPAVTLRQAAGGVPTDRFWGPLQVDAGLAEVQRSLLHSFVVLIALAAILWKVRTAEVSAARARKQRRARWALGLLLLAGLDIGFATVDLIARVNRQTEAALLGRDHETPEAHRWLRTRSEGGWPKRWRKTASETRLVDVESSQRAAWFGRWHLATGAAVFNNLTSIRSHEIALFWEAVAELGDARGQPTAFWKAIRTWLAIDGRSHTTGRSARLTFPDSTHTLAEVRRARRPKLAGDHGVRLEAQWTTVSAGPPDETAMASLLRDVIRSNGRPEPRVSAEKGIEEPASPPERREALQTSLSVEPTVVPERAAIRVRCERGGLLIRPVYQDGNWVAERTAADGESVSVDVHQVDYLAQGVYVPPGDWTVRFRYAPWWLLPSLAIAMVTWSATAGWVVAGIVKRSVRQRVASNLRGPFA